jgi:hypothetical protein
MKDRVGVGVGTEADNSCVGVGRCFLQFRQVVVRVYIPTAPFRASTCMRDARRCRLDDITGVGVGVHVL